MTREKKASITLELMMIGLTYKLNGNEMLSENEADSTRNAIDALDVAIAALRGSQADPKTGLVPCGGKMRIDIPPGNDSVRASTGFQRDGGDKTERRCNQCVHCGQEMPEGDQVCGYCRRQHGY